MLTAKEFNGKSIISIANGVILGEVKDVYLDADMRQMAGVYLRTEGLIKRKDKVILRNSIQVLGVDVWLVSGSDVIVDKDTLPDAAGFNLVGQLRGREIQTDGGTKIGVIEDVLLDENMGVLGFSLGKVYAQGPLAERKAVIRDAIKDLGSKDGPMIVDLALAEAGVIAT